jgi:hypothetical protein
LPAPNQISWFGVIHFFPLDSILYHLIIPVYHFVLWISG